MKIRRFFITFAIILFCQVTYAQKKRAKTPAKKKVETVQRSPEELLFENMLESTQRVFFIDSIVVDKEDFIKHIPLPRECGTISAIQEGENTGAAYINEFGNKKYYSVRDTTGNAAIYTSDKLGNDWSKPMGLTGIDNITNPDYPFMMPDGTTFYFSQTGDDTLGGYDIFVTRYDGSTGEFLKPNNMGLPFNSTANDYMYVVDELDSLGWLVTDRFQPEGKVCIYTFVPSKTRENFDLAEMSESEVRQFATIQSIQDTWPSEEAHEVALQRLQNMMTRNTQLHETASFTFEINDEITYHSPDDFLSASARKKFMELLQLKERNQENLQRLETMRERYYHADDAERASMRKNILDAEKELERQNVSILNSEKNIRNEEIMLLTK
ncbi:MAG: hypothetical protein IKX65_04215 [Prevotella sp.]|nr:hypothetical protein [Prevotella sp.]